MLLVLLVVAGLLGGVAAYAYLTMPEPGPTATNFDRLRTGMTANDVAAALGPPDYVKSSSGSTLRLWNVGGEIIAVRFSADERVMHGFADFESGRHLLRPPFSLLDTVKSLLGL